MKNKKLKLKLRTFNFNHQIHKMLKEKHFFNQMKIKL